MGIAAELALVVLLLAVASAPPPREVAPSEWPLERIVANLEARLAETPDDAEAHYNLGRAHAFAFALERSTLWNVFGGRYIHDREKQRALDATDPERAAPPPPTPEERLAHLAAGVRHLRRACALAAEDALTKGRHHLTLAWLLETGAPFASQVDTPALLGDDEPPSAEDETGLRLLVDELGSSDLRVAVAAEKSLAEPEYLTRALPLLHAERSSPAARRGEAVERLLRRAWIERAIAEYAVALERAFPVESSGEGLPPRNDEELRHLVSYEALEGWRRLVQERGVRPMEEARLRELEAMQQKLEELPRSEWITPMVVSLACATLDELVLPAASVPFDLDGDGVDELWPWIAPGTGWLVWDPARRGEITSGRQLFGTASAWLFFADGYRALDALDDDRDGALRGEELAGIAVWFDRDTDGISDRGEVVPVEELGIAALSTSATEQIGRSLGNPCGLELADGRVLPTYDWVLGAPGPRGSSPALHPGPSSSSASAGTAELQLGLRRAPARRS